MFIFHPRTRALYQAFDAATIQGGVNPERSRAGGKCPVVPALEETAERKTRDVEFFAKHHPHDLWQLHPAPLRFTCRAPRSIPQRTHSAVLSSPSAGRRSGRFFR